MRPLKIAVLAVFALISLSTGGRAATLVLGFGPYSGMLGTVHFSASGLSPTGNGRAYVSKVFAEVGNDSICPSCSVDSVAGGYIDLLGFEPSSWSIYADSFNYRGVGPAIALGGTPLDNYIEGYVNETGYYQRVQLSISPWTVAKPVPLPGALPLLAVGLVALAGLGLSRKR